MDSLKINGAFTKPLSIFKDERGAVLKMVQKSSPMFESFAEFYFSITNPGVVKGWKKHFRAIQLFAVPVGKMKIVLYDDRENSDSKGEVEEIILSSESNETYKLLKIPPEVWYSFSAIGESPSMIANLTTEEHDPKESIGIPLDSDKIPYQWH